MSFTYSWDNNSLRLPGLLEMDNLPNIDDMLLSACNGPLPLPIKNASALPTLNGSIFWSLGLIAYQNCSYTNIINFYRIIPSSPQPIFPHNFGYMSNQEVFPLVHLDLLMSTSQHELHHDIWWVPMKEPASKMIKCKWFCYDIIATRLKWGIWQVLPSSFHVIHKKVLYHHCWMS